MRSAVHGSDFDDSNPAEPNEVVRASIRKIEKGAETTAPQIRLLRRHRRLPTQIRAVLYHHDSFQPTTIFDTSVGGVGIEGAKGLFHGDEVKIGLVSGQTYNGVVRWWFNGRCGIAFKNVLDDDDALMQLASKKMRAMSR
jgi:hypothetical protein